MSMLSLSEVQLVFQNMLDKLPLFVPLLCGEKQCFILQGCQPSTVYAI